MILDHGELILRGAGMDCVGNLVQDGHIRPIKVDGEIYGSLVDLMAVFGEDNRKSKRRAGAFNARRYWNEVKKSLLGKDRELYDSIGQLKLRASDGKYYRTDVAPLWACVFVVLLMDTPRATEFKKRVAKFTAAEIKYRLMNVARGLEWDADSIHEELQELELPETDPPFADMGYIVRGR